MDGGPIYGPATGGTPQNFSQEVVREFQISTVNFDLSTGLTGSGAINVATRYGGNDYHGSGFFFFRDHNMAAYPALRREPANPDPFFARRQAGFNVGGPLKKDRLFFFTTFEHLNQDGAVTIQSRTPELSSLGGIFPSNLTGNQVTARLDARINETNSFFLRYSHDGNNGLVPGTGTGSLPSNWSLNSNWADQSIGSLTTAVAPQSDKRVASLLLVLAHAKSTADPRTVSGRVRRIWIAADRNFGHRFHGWKLPIGATGRRLPSLSHCR